MFRYRALQARLKYLSSSVAVPNGPQAGGIVIPATVPAQFEADDWSVADDVTGGDITITITTLPDNGGSVITDLQYRLDSGSWVSLGDITTGNYAVTGLTDDQEYSVTVRAVNSVGNGAASAVETVTPTAGVPAQFLASQWSVTDAATSGDIVITITSLPDNHGSAITDIEYQIDGGSWVSLEAAIADDYPVAGLTDTVEVDIAIRAINAIGNGTASATKAVTPTAGPATAPAQFGTGDWTVTDDQTSGDITISIFTLPDNGGSVITDIEYQLDGGSWVSLSTDEIGDYSVSGLTDDQEYDVSIRAVNAVGNGTAATVKTVTPTALTTFEYGWDETLNEGTTGDWFVDGSVTSSGDGSTLATAFKTITEAVTAASGGDVIRIKDHGSPYREQITLSNKGGPSSSNKTTFIGYGTDKPTISGADVLEGLVPCTSDDEDIVGSNWASIYKIENFDSTQIAESGPSVLNLFEDGEPLHLVIDRADDADPFFINDPDTYWDAETFYTTGDVPATEDVSVITGLKDTSVTDLYTTTQILNAEVVFHHRDNRNSRVKVDSFDSDDDIIHFTTTQLYESNQNKTKWALVNILPKLSQGKYGYIDNGDGTCNIYVWPNNSANITSGIEFSARSIGFELSGTADNFEFASLRIVQQSAVSGSGGHLAGLAFKCGSNKKSNITIRNCYIAYCMVDDDGYGAVHMRNVDGLVFQHNTVENIRGTYGLFLQGGGVGNPLSNTVFAENGTISYNLFDKVESAGVRVFSAKGLIVAYNKLDECSKNAHANKMNFYEQCHDILVWGNDFTNTDGYFTWQECSNIFVAFNYIPVQFAPFTSDAPGRAMADQNNATAVPSTYLGNGVTSLIFNNLLQPYYESLESENSMVLGKSGHPSVLYSYWNNILHGAGGYDPVHEEHDYNIDTSIDGTLTEVNGSHVDYTDVYEDAANDDFTIKTDSPTKTFVGKDMRQLIADVLIPRFGDRFTDWSKDMYGNVVDWTDAPAGEKNWRSADADVAAPTVVTFNPTDNATGVAIDSSFVITFNEPVVAGTGDISIYAASDDSLIEDFDVESDVVFSNTTVTITPTFDLTGETSYYIQIDATAIEDISGNAFAGIADKTTWSFTTEAAEDVTAPTVSSLSPIDGGTDIAINTNLVITFNEPVVAGTGNIVIYDASDDSEVETFDVTTDVTFNSDEVTINPTSDLSNSTNYYVQIDATAIEDASGNAFAGIADKTTWNFSTVAAAPPAVNDVHFSDTTWIESISVTAAPTLTIAMKIRDTVDGLNKFFIASGSDTYIRHNGTGNRVTFRGEYADGSQAFSISSSTIYNTTDQELCIVASCNATRAELVINGVLEASADYADASQNFKIPTRINAVSDAGASARAFDIIGPVWMANEYLDASDNYSNFFDGSGNPIFEATVNSVTADLFLDGDAAYWNALSGGSAGATKDGAGTITDN